MADTEKIFGRSPEEAVGELLSLYKGDAEPNLKILDSFYSNIALVQITPRDFAIDFIRAPGEVRDGKLEVVGMRIVLPHTAALALAKVIPKLFEKGDKEGKIERA
jgi:hypothetical protein